MRFFDSNNLPCSAVARNASVEGKHISSVSGDLGRSDVDMEIVSRLGDQCDKTAYKPPYLNRYAIRVDL